MKRKIIIALIVISWFSGKVKGQELAITGGAAWNTEFVSDGTEGHWFGSYFAGFQYAKAINPNLYIVANPTVMFYNIGKLDEEGDKWKNINIEIPLMGRSHLFRLRAVRFLWGVTPGITVSSKYQYYFNPTSTGDIMFDLFQNPNYDPDAQEVAEEDVKPRNPYLKLVVGAEMPVMKKFVISAILDYRITNLSPEIPPKVDYEDRVTVLAFNIKVAYRIK
jgi:hypothetical protein